MNSMSYRTLYLGLVWLIYDELYVLLYTLPGFGLVWYTMNYMSYHTLHLGLVWSDLRRTLCPAVSRICRTWSLQMSIRRPGNKTGIDSFLILLDILEKYVKLSKYLNSSLKMAITPCIQIYAIYSLNCLLSGKIKKFKIFHLHSKNKLKEE